MTTDTTTLLSSISRSLVFPPHSHSDLPIEGQPSTVAPFFTTGAQHPEETFRLHVVPLQNGYRLVGYSAFNWWELDSTPQHMYGPAQSLDELTDLLSSRLQLPAVQISNVRSIALKGIQQEIGREGRATVCLFRRSTLESLGLTFRPPEEP